MTHRDSVSEVSVHGWLVCGCGLELMQCIMGEISIESSSPDGSKEANSPTKGARTPASSSSTAHSDLTSYYQVPSLKGFTIPR